MKRPSKQERRSVKRRSLAYYMLVRDAYTQKTIGHLVNITPSGLMMDSQQALPLQKDFRLSLDITPEVARQSTISFTARSKWWRRDIIEPSLYDIGFSIQEISPGDFAILQRLTEKYTVRDNYSFP